VGPATAPTSRAELLGAARARLAEAGLEAPADEARRLWLDLAPGGDARAWPDPAAEVPAAEATRFLAAVQRRAAGEPRAHVTGIVGFRHLVLRADRRALIPRPETEGLVERALACGRGGRVADIGTGGGCIALSLRQEGAFDRVTGIDLSGEALALARENARSTGLQVDWVRGDLTLALADRSLDLLVSNPPYLTEAEWRDLDSSVRRWEPPLAFASGSDGLAATRRLLDDGRRVLCRGGWLVLELDSTRAALAAAEAKAAGWRDVQVAQDLFGRERFLVALNA
jgi:release factor glutamine methyltransferase